MLEKLKSRENYPTWKIAMEAYLQYEDLWGCVVGAENYVADNKKVIKARSRILLSIETINSHSKYDDCKGSLGEATGSFRGFRPYAKGQPVKNPGFHTACKLQVCRGVRQRNSIYSAST